MRVLLRLAALVSLAWAVLLLGLKAYVMPGHELGPLTQALANGLGITRLVLAYIFWSAAQAPAAHRRAIYAAIALMALSTANDLYQLLVLLPPTQALVSLADLVLSVGLLVGILEALPRVLGHERASASRDEPAQ